MDQSFTFYWKTLWNVHYQLFNTTVKICSFCSISHGEICSQNQWKPCLNYCGIWNTDKISRIYQQNICSVALKKIWNFFSLSCISSCLLLIKKSWSFVQFSSVKLRPTIGPNKQGVLRSKSQSIYAPLGFFKLTNMYLISL